MSRSSVENMKAFEERIRRIEKSGGRDGRTSYKRSGEYFRKEEERKRQRKKGRKANWTFRILLVLACVLGVKTYIMASMGAEAYGARMAELQAGDKYQKIAFIFMQPDPLTGKLQEMLEKSGAFERKSSLRTTTSLPTAADQAAPEKNEAGLAEGEPASGASGVDAVSN